MSNRKKINTSRVRKRRAKRGRIKRCALIISGAAFLIVLVCCVISFFWQRREQAVFNSQKTLPKITIDTKLLKVNKYSRPGTELKTVKGIVVHYTANPGTDALDNRNYFNNLPTLNKGKKNPTYASSHFVIGLSGQIVQCVPLNEIAYASNDRNSDTISIECCHPDKTGEFRNATYESLIELLAYLCIRYDLEEEDIIRHYDVTGKKCPLYYVEHEDEWKKLKQDVKNKVCEAH